MNDVSIKPGYDKKLIAKKFMELIAGILSEEDGESIRTILKGEGEGEGEGEEGSGLESGTWDWVWPWAASRWEIDLTIDGISNFKFDRGDIDKINKGVESFINFTVDAEREKVGRRPIQEDAEKLVHELGALRGGDDEGVEGEGQPLIKKENIDECLKHILSVDDIDILSNDSFSYYTMGMKEGEEEDEGEKDDLFNYIITNKVNLLKKIIRPKALKKWGKEYKTKIKNVYVKKLKEFVKSTNCKKEIERYNRGQKYLEKLKDHLKYTKIFTVTNNEINQIENVLELYDLEFGGGKELPLHAPPNSWIFILINGIKKKDYRYLSNSYICRREGVLEEGDEEFKDYFNDKIKYIGQYLSLKIMKINCLVYEKKSDLMTTFEEGDFEKLEKKLWGKIDEKKSEQKITEINTDKLTERLDVVKKSITYLKSLEIPNYIITEYLECDETNEDHFNYYRKLYKLLEELKRDLNIINTKIVKIDDIHDVEEAMDWIERLKVTINEIRRLKVTFEKEECPKSDRLQSVGCDEINKEIDKVLKIFEAQDVPLLDETKVEKIFKTNPKIKKFGKLLDFDFDDYEVYFQSDNFGIKEKKSFISKICRAIMNYLSNYLSPGIDSLKGFRKGGPTWKARRRKSRQLTYGLFKVISSPIMLLYFMLKGGGTEIFKKIGNFYRRYVKYKKYPVLMVWAWDRMKDSVIQAGGNAADILRRGFSSIGRSMKSVVKRLGRGIYKTFKAGWDAISNAMVDIEDWAIKKKHSIVRGAKNAKLKLGNNLKDAWDVMGNFVNNFVDLFNVQVMGLTSQDDFRVNLKKLIEVLMLKGQKGRKYSEYLKKYEEAGNTIGSSRTIGQLMVLNSLINELKKDPERKDDQSQAAGAGREEEAPGAGPEEEAAGAEPEPPEPEPKPTPMERRNTLRNNREIELGKQQKERIIEQNIEREKREIQELEEQINSIRSTKEKSDFQNALENLKKKRGVTKEKEEVEFDNFKEGATKKEFNRFKEVTRYQGEFDTFKSKITPESFKKLTEEQFEGLKEKVEEQHVKEQALREEPRQIIESTLESAKKLREQHMNELKVEIKFKTTGNKIKNKVVDGAKRIKQMIGIEVSNELDKICHTTTGIFERLGSNRDLGIIYDSFIRHDNCYVKIEYFKRVFARLQLTNWAEQIYESKEKEETSNIKLHKLDTWINELIPIVDEITKFLVEKKTELRGKEKELKDKVKALKISEESAGEEEKDYGIFKGYITDDGGLKLHDGGEEQVAAEAEEEGGEDKELQNLFKEYIKNRDELMDEKKKLDRDLFQKYIEDIKKQITKMDKYIEYNNDKFVNNETETKKENLKTEFSHVIYKIIEESEKIGKKKEKRDAEIAEYKATARRQLEAGVKGLSSMFKGANKLISDLEKDEKNATGTEKVILKEKINELKSQRNKETIKKILDGTLKGEPKQMLELLKDIQKDIDKESDPEEWMRIQALMDKLKKQEQEQEQEQANKTDGKDEDEDEDEDETDGKDDPDETISDNIEGI